MTDLERAVLELEVAWALLPQRDGRKGDAIAALGLTETNYYQVLARLAWEPEAMALEPGTMRGIRHRAARRHAGR